MRKKERKIRWTNARQTTIHAKIIRCPVSRRTDTTHTHTHCIACSLRWSRVYWLLGSFFWCLRTVSWHCETLNFHASDWLAGTFLFSSSALALGLNFFFSFVVIVVCNPIFRSISCAQHYFPFLSLLLFACVRACVYVRIIPFESFVKFLFIFLSAFNAI